MKNTRVLIVGAGGLGCELLKQFCELEISKIHVIDMDTIELSNLNRQFLFRDADLGKPKATTAVDYLKDIYPEAQLVSIYGKLEDQPLSFYAQFDLIVSGLDSVEARRILNAYLYSLAANNSTYIPWIDGGTEGYRGQCRVVYTTFSACFECSLKLFPTRKSYPICTITTTPRQPEHLIEWAVFLECPRRYKNLLLDKENIEHIKIVHEIAKERAKEFNINKPSIQLTYTVMKNVVPAIASTNAIVAAMCVMEALKLLTGCLPNLNNYWSYNGEEDIYAHSFELLMEEDCPLCSSKSIEIKTSKNTSLKEFITTLEEHPNIKCKDLNLTTPDKTLYMQAPEKLKIQTSANLELSIGDLLKDKDIIILTSKNIAHSISIKILISE